VKPSVELLQALAVTVELTGTELSEAAARIFAEDLARYPITQVLAALTRCRRELKGRLTIADVVSRLDDGRPGVEEAWAMLPRDESVTAVWTEEMARAASIARELMSRDEVAARMAFKETYLRYCQEARDKGDQVTWNVSLGWDKGGRESVVAEAVRSGRISANRAMMILPEIDMDTLFLESPKECREQFKSLTEKMLFKGVL
jgi:hypothetical protein